jgi:hypothetical protein
LSATSWSLTGMLTSLTPRIMCFLLSNRTIACKLRECNRVEIAIVTVGTAMTTLDDYVTDVLMRDLIGHDKRPVCFLVYVWLAAEEQRRGGTVQISYQDLAESIGVSRSSAQAAVSWLLRRKLLEAARTSVTATPCYRVQTPWRRGK